LSGIWDLPFGPNRQYMKSNAWCNRGILRDWRLTGIWAVARATSVSITAINNTDTSFVTSFYATRVCDPYSGVGNQTVDHWFNTNCFVNPAPGQYGIGGNNGIRGPHTNNVDISVSKLWPIRERGQLQLRGDFFNIFNHPQLYLSPENLTSGQYGQITGAYPQRTIQVSLRFAF
jgi:hypothetical protein